MRVKLDQKNEWKEKVYLGLMDEERALYEWCEIKREIPLKKYEELRLKVEIMKNMLFND